MRMTKSYGSYSSVSSRLAIMSVSASLLAPVTTGALMAQEQEEADKNFFSVETIVVTARRREENVQDVPISVTALTANALERQQIFDTTELDQVTPNLQFTSYGPLSGNNSAAQVFIRGIGQTDPTGAVDPGVGIYIDDVYMGRSVGGAMDFRDIASVSVLRGPQGTLFGRNTIGGAVQLTTKAPEIGGEFGGTLRARTGTDDLVEIFTAVNIPMSDTLASRLAFGTRKRDGYVIREFDGIDLGDDNSWSLNGSMLWAPADNFEFTLRADYSNEDENGSPFVFQAINTDAIFVKAAAFFGGCPGAVFPVSTPTDVLDDRCPNNLQYKGPYTNGGTAEVYSTTENWGVSGTAAWDINDSLTLKSISAYRSLEWTGARDGDNTPALILHTQYASKSTQFSQELQGLYSSDKLNGVVGLYYFEETTNDEVRVDLALAPPNSRDFQNVELTTESWAAFTEWSYNVTEQLGITGGIRYTEETKGMQLIAFNINPGSLPDPSPLPSSVADGLFIDPSLHKEKFSAATGTIKAQYRVSDSFMTYVSWSQGFKSGGFNQRYNAPTPDNQPISFEPEKATTWEVGFKTDVNGSLRLNGSVFSSRYKDMQLIYRLGVVPLLYNAGKSKIEGFELEATYTPTSKLLIEGSLGYMKSTILEIIDIPGTTQTLGLENSLPFTPTWSGNIGASYIFTFGDYELTPRVDVSYTDDLFYDAANSVEVMQAAQTIVNTSLQLSNPDAGWRMVFGVNNLTDKIYQVAGNSSFGGSLGYAEAIYARDRNWFLSLQYDF